MHGEDMDSNLMMQKNIRFNDLKRRYE